jgi:HD-like signal output (HDOD) protein
VAESIIKSLLKECSVEYESLWKHALATAVCAEAIVGKTFPNLKAEAFLGGLLHDVGKLILRDCFPKKFEEIKISQIEQGTTCFQALNEYSGS